MENTFYCRKSKINKQGLSPIYAKITLNGIKKDRSTGIRCIAENWDSGYKTVKNDLDATKQILDFEIALRKRYKVVKSNLNGVTYTDLDAPKEKTIVEAGRAWVEVQEQDRSSILKFACFESTSSGSVGLIVEGD